MRHFVSQFRFVGTHFRLFFRKSLVHLRTVYASPQKLARPLISTIIIITHFYPPYYPHHDRHPFLQPSEWFHDRNQPRWINSLDLLRMIHLFLPIFFLETCSAFLGRDASSPAQSEFMLSIVPRRMLSSPRLLTSGRPWVSGTGKKIKERTTSGEEG